MTPKPRPRKPRDAATLRAVARDMKHRAKGWREEATTSRQASFDGCQARADELNFWATHYLEQARALEKMK